MAERTADDLTDDGVDEIRKLLKEFFAMLNQRQTPYHVTISAMQIGLITALLCNGDSKEASLEKFAAVWDILKAEYDDA